MNHEIAVLDFGGQYAHLITNRIRRLGVHAVIKDHDSTAEDLKDYAGIILSGGPQSVNGAEAVLTETEKELGCILVDIGAGTSDLCLYIDGAVAYTAVLPLGSKNVSSDIAAGLRIALA